MRRSDTAPLDLTSSLDRAAPALWAVGVVLVAAAGGLAIALGEAGALVICLAIIASVFILYDFRAGVVMLILMMPVSASQIFPHAMFGVTGLNPLNLLLAATFGSLALREVGQGGLKGFAPAPLVWLFVVPVFLAGLLGSRHVGEIATVLREYDGVAYGSAFQFVRDMAVKPLFMTIFALLVAAAVARSKEPERLLVPALVSVWIMGLMVILFVAKEGVSLGELSSPRFRQFFLPLGIHANDLGRLYMVAYAILLFTWAATDRPLAKLLLFGSMILVTGALVLTMSRGAFLGFALVNVWFLATRRTAGAFLTALIVVVMLGLLLPESVYTRLATAFSGEMGDRSAGRTDQIWTPLYPELLTSPIWGQGLGAIMWSDALRGGRIFPVTHPHNAYLRIALDMGIIGTVLVLAYWAHVWRTFRRLANDAGQTPTLRGFFAGARAGLAGFLLAGVAGSALTPVPEQSFLWLAIGVAYGLQARKAE